MPFFLAVGWAAGIETFPWKGSEVDRNLEESSGTRSEALLDSQVYHPVAGHLGNWRG